MLRGADHDSEIIVILYFSYEELRALKVGVDSVLVDDRRPGVGAILAPSEIRGRVEALAPHLVGDLSFTSLDELLGVQMAVRAILECLRAEMEALVVATHAAQESAVAAYFDYAHALTVAHRVDEMVSEMSAMIDLVTGVRQTAETARSFQFPD